MKNTVQEIKQDVNKIKDKVGHEVDELKHEKPKEYLKHKFENVGHKAEIVAHKVSYGVKKAEHKMAANFKKIQRKMKETMRKVINKLRHHKEDKKVTVAVKKVAKVPEKKKKVHVYANQMKPIPAREAFEEKLNSVIIDSRKLLNRRRTGTLFNQK